MQLNDAQIAELRKPLDRAHVAKRQQGGSQVSYVEGWHVIAEANRIFGFDAWNRETVELRQLGEPRDVNGKMRVDYMARVRIRVGDIIRDGCGFGQGIDKDVGQAHESALKEAETDAMKRALMTFGNPFGLALYDKTQANVAEAAPPVIDDGQWAEIVQLIEATKTDTAILCENYKVSSLKDLLVPQFEHARAILRKRLPKPEQKAA